MADPEPSLPRPSLQPPTVDFIDNHLPKFDPAFVNPPACYDPVSKQYIPKSMPMTSPPGNGSWLAVGSSPGSSEIANIETDLVHCGTDPPVRPALTNTQAMAYWNDIFPKAMAQLKQKREPQKRPDQYKIRDACDWTDIYDVLEMARDEYNSEAGPKGKMRKMWRKVADNIDPIAGVANSATKIAPQDPYASPVLGALDVICKAIGTAASVRKEMLEGIDGIVPIFSDVELFLSTFPRDEKIRDSALELTVTTLVAIEQAIGFFISNEFIRALKAAALAGSYEKNVRESLRAVNAQSRSLMEEAIKSHIHESHHYSKETQKILFLLQGSFQKAANSLNSIERLLADHKLEREQWLERDRQKDQKLEALQVENSHLFSENIVLRTHSPLMQGYWAPPPQPQKQITAWSINQATLQQMLHASDLDLIDVACVEDKKSELPWKQRVRSEQITSAKLFQEWIVSPISTKLLVQWNMQPPKTVAGVSPLSIFIGTMAQALRGKQGFVSTIWFTGRHIDTADAGPHVGGRAMLASFVDQLLRQYAFDLQPLANVINLAGLQTGGPNELLNLLVWLVQQLPRTMTFICIIDEVALLEREEHQDEALPALVKLLSLVKDPTINAAMKILFTSTLISDIVSAAFEQEDLVLNVEGLAQMVWAPNEERVIRELEEGIQDF